MNIHFNDRLLLEALNKATIHSQKMGSHLYGLNNEKSDEDTLSVYVDSHRNHSSMMWIHHQLQFKEEGVDRNFCDIKLLARNVLTGDSTVSFEVIWSKDIEHSALGGITEFREDLINFRVIRSYLGLARRDFKSLHKMSSGFRKVDDDVRKKASHFIRGVLFAEQLLAGEFDLTLGGRNDGRWQVLDKVKNGMADEGIEDLCRQYETTMIDARKTIQLMHDKKEINIFMEAARLRQFDDFIKDTIMAHQRETGIDYGDLFYNVMEKGLEY